MYFENIIHVTLYTSLIVVSICIIYRLNHSTVAL